MSSHVISGQGDRSIIQVLADLTSPAGDSIGQWRVAVTRFDGEPVVTGFGAG